MVKYWDKQIEIGIKLTKFRIKHHEYHGDGNSAIKDKQILKKQERKKQLRQTK